jgi:RND family efflux transporter MFP subunit
MTAGKLWSFLRRKSLAGVGLGLLLTLAACGERNAYKPPPPPQVTVTRPERRPVTGYLEFTGNTQAINTVTLKARVQGFLEKVFFQDGDRVKKGQLLFLIQPNTYEDQLRQAVAQILQQEANFRYALIQVGRYTKLVQQKAGAQSDLDNWRFQRDSSQAQVLGAKANRDLAALNLGYTKVTAPFDGRIDRRLVDPGNLVGAGEFTPLAQINQIDPIYVYFTINEADLLRVMGQTGKLPGEVGKTKVPLDFGLANESGYPHRGYFDFAAISVTSTTGTLLLRGVFPNPDYQILPGLYARIRGPLVGSAKESWLVPEVAIGYDQLGSYVLVVGENNVVERRAVKVGAQVESRRVIDTGLSGNEEVITNGLLRAIPGKPVTPAQETPPPVPTKEGGPSPQGKPGDSPK